MISPLPPPPELPPGSIVDAYLRDSGGPHQEASTEQQLLEIQRYCTQHNLKLRHKYIDVARSGGSTAAREQFNEMLDRYRHLENRPHGLLLWNYARFARDLKDATYYKYKLRVDGIFIYSLTDPIPEGPYGPVVEFIIDVTNEEKRRQTSADAKRGLRDLVLAHGCVPGTPPRGFHRTPVDLGFRRDGSPRIGHRWEPDPELIPRVQLAFQMRAEGGTLSQIHAATHLYTGVNCYRTFFSNPIYIGILHYGDQVVESYCEPVIDMATWKAVQERIEAHTQGKRTRHHPRRANSPYLLSGLLYCAECGSPLSGNTVTRTARGRNEAYRCSRSKRRAGCAQGRIGRLSLERQVLATLKDYVLLPEAIAATAQLERTATDRQAEQRATRLSALTDDRARLSRQIANLTRAIAEKGHSDALLERLTQLESERAQVNAEIKELGERRLEPVQLLSEEQLRALSDRLTQILENGPPEQMRQILRALVYKITVKKEDPGQITGTITYYSPASLSDPPFESSPSTGKGSYLPIPTDAVGAPLYRQTFTCPIKQIDH